MAAYGKVVGGAWADSTDYIRRLNKLRQTDPGAVRQIEQRADKIHEGYTEEEVYSKGGATKTPGARYEDSRRESMSRAMEEALEEYERMVAATGPVGGGMLDTYEQPDLEIDLEDLASTQYEDARGPAVNPYSLEEEVEEEAVVPEAGGFRSLSRDRVYEIIKEMNPQLSEQELNRVVEKAIAAGGEGAGAMPSLEEQIVDVREPPLDTSLFKSEEELAQMTPAERMQYRKDRLRLAGRGSQVRDTGTGKTTEELGAVVGADYNERMRDVYRQRPQATPSRPEATIQPATQAPTARGGEVIQKTAHRQRPQTAQPALPSAGVAQEEEQGDGLMSRLAGLGGGIGGFVKDNPDLMLQGLQTVGELGGAYKQGRREEEAAKRMAEEARMGTAISALTRGRVTPSVAPQMPRTSAGEGMFDVMAGIGRGGQEFMAGKRQRADKLRAEGMEDEDRAQLGEDRTRALEMYNEERDWAREDRDIAAEGRERAAEQAEYEREQAEEQTKYERGQTAKDRKEALEERLAASDLSEKEKEEERERWEREQGRKDREATVKEREVAVKEAEQAEKSVPKIETVTTADARVIAEGINAMIDIFDKGWASETGTWAPERTYGDSAGIQAEFDGIKTALIGRMKKFQELDRLSDMDYQIILRSLPDRGKSSGWNDGKRRGIFRALEIASEGQWKAPPIPSFWEGVFGGADDEAPRGESAAVEEVEELTPEQVEELLDRAEDDDMEAVAELKRHGLIDN